MHDRNWEVWEKGASMIIMEGESHAQNMFFLLTGRREDLVPLVLLR